jgi:hypothetical protein
MESPIAYQFHVALRGISPRIWRRIELSAFHSLADLQRVIQISFGWSDEYQRRFCIRHHHLGASRPGGLLFFGNPEELTLRQFAFRKNERFTYEYNFFDGWVIDVRFEGEHDIKTESGFPRCIAGARLAPAEDSGGAEKFMECNVPESAPARRARHQVRQLRELANLLNDPALNDVTVRIRTRAILQTRPKPDFDRRALNDLLGAVVGCPRHTKEAVHGDTDSIDC